MRDLPTTLSKFLSLGMPLGDVVRAATSTPARAIGRSGELGSLAPGAAGDAAVFAIEEGRFPYQDADGNVLEGAQALGAPAHRARRPRVVAPLAAELSGRRGSAARLSRGRAQRRSTPSTIR